MINSRLIQVRAGCLLSLAICSLLFQYHFHPHCYNNHYDSFPDPGLSWMFAVFWRSSTCMFTVTTTIIIMNHSLIQVRAGCLLSLAICFSSQLFQYLMFTLTRLLHSHCDSFLIQVSAGCSLSSPSSSPLWSSSTCSPSLLHHHYDDSSLIQAWTGCLLSSTDVPVPCSPSLLHSHCDSFLIQVSAGCSLSSDVPVPHVHPHYYIIIMIHS